MKVRLDKLVQERELAPSRERAQALILAGRVLVNEQKLTKPGMSVAPDAVLRVLGDDLRYVSRGGLKLERALEHWKIDLSGRVCMDVGASTGGFSDCMLQHGAARVIAVDTGYGQIDAKLRGDARVRLLEKTNARYLEAEAVGEAVSFVAMDVSFISATLVLPAVVKSIQQSAISIRRGDSGSKAREEGAVERGPEGPLSHRAAARSDVDGRQVRWLEAVVLVKPQFEAGREAVGKGGIVREESAQMAAVERVRSAMAALGFAGLEWIESPIRGAEGNREFLMHGNLVI